MHETPVEQELRAAATRYSTTFIDHHLPATPQKHYIVVTCMDGRIDPAKAFGVKLGDAHVIRNAGGSTEDALPSIVASQLLMKTTEILVIKHTDCGMQKHKNGDIHNKIQDIFGTGVAAMERRKFHFFEEVEKAIAHDVAFLRSCGVVPKSTVISGWVYDVEHGTTERVTRARDDIDITSV